MSQLDQTSHLYRPEAVAHRAVVEAEPHVLQLTPRWTRRTYWLLVFVATSAMLMSLVGTVHEYAAGLAVIRREGQHDVRARFAGTVAEIAVQPGQRVATGAVLARLYDATESAELERTRSEFELQLVRLLRDPADDTARIALTGLRAEYELAERRLAERTIRAPHSGTVSDVRIRLGQQLMPGELLLSLADPNAPCKVLAMVPGHYRPQVHAGMPLRLELDGYRYAYRELPIDRVNDEIVGPSELKRFLGPELADTLELAGPMLLVQAHLPSTTFRARGDTLHYYDGMRARANIRVRTTNVLATLIPSFRYLFEAVDE